MLNEKLFSSVLHFLLSDKDDSSVTGTEIAYEWIDAVEREMDLRIPARLERDIVAYAEMKLPRAVAYFERKYPEDDTQDIEDVSAEAVSSLISSRFRKSVLQHKPTTDDVNEIAGDFSVSGTRRMEAPGNLQKGGSYRGSRGDVLSDFENEPQIIDAVAVYVENPEGLILTVTRDKATMGPNPNDVNMPGGVIDPGEDAENAAARELFEETGIVAHNLVPVYTGESSGKTVTTFRATSWGGEVKSSWEGTASWQPPEALLHSTFGRYFSEVLRATGKR